MDEQVDHVCQLDCQIHGCPLEGDDGPLDDEWIARAYERQHPKTEPDTMVGMTGR